MGYLGPILFLGLSISLATFLIMWNFRGRGFRELLPWRRTGGR